MTASSRPSPSPLFRWLILLLGAPVIAVGLASLWIGLQYTLRGVPATGRVIEFHHPMPHNLDVIAQVDVTLAGVRPFRTEIESNLVTDDWVAGETTIALRCVHGDSGRIVCTVDSALGRFAFPLVALAVGSGMVWWGVTRVRSRH
jgi:hypothetical protein